MLILTIISAIIGLSALGFSGSGTFGLIAAGFFFACGLPFALIGSFVHGEVSYAQDRADYRQHLSERSEDGRALDREMAEDLRAGRLAESEKPSVTQIYNDRGQVNLYGGENGN